MPGIAPATLERLATRAATRRPIVGLSVTSNRNLKLRSFTSSTSLYKPNKENADRGEKPENISQFHKRSTARSTVSKNSLRRVATNEAGDKTQTPFDATRKVTAYCTAETYNLQRTTSLLQSGGYIPDPLSTGLIDEVIHLRLPLPAHSLPPTLTPPPESPHGDIFIFPSGNIVSWAIPESTITAIVALILPSAERPHKETETENLEFIEDDTKPRSYIRGDIITIGTGSESSTAILAKIAFSSGLARSTKLAVLESLLNTYLASTSSIPYYMSMGSRLPFTRSFILRKTGELFSFRAQLNLYSELTDSLPDIFWDSRQELGLEGYYESVGRELDVGVRIRQLNEKLDYASEMAQVLRERLSERHGLVLEWMIIVLIAVEVGFEILRLWKEHKNELKEEREKKKKNKSAISDVDANSEDEDLREIGRIRARIEHRRQQQQQQQKKRSINKTSATESVPEEWSLRRQIRLAKEADDRRQLLMYEQQRQQSAVRPSAAAADENFEYQHRTPGDERQRGTPEEWFVSWVPYDIRSWGGWR